MVTDIFYLSSLVGNLGNFYKNLWPTLKTSFFFPNPLAVLKLPKLPTREMGFTEKAILLLKR
jgi:hypothetical protein